MFQKVSPNYNNQFLFLSSYNNNEKRKSPLKSVYALRHKAYEKEITTDDKIRAGIGAVLGTIIPMIFLMKQQKLKNPFNIKFELKEMVLLSATSIIGGVSAGMISEKKTTNIHKLKEGVFQFFNAVIPAVFVDRGLKLCEKSANKPLPKILVTTAGIAVGMHAAAMLSNKICDPKDVEPDRKLSLKDSIANIDDLVGALVLAKVPLINKLKIERVLPFIYSYCGYRAGESN